MRRALLLGLLLLAGCATNLSVLKTAEPVGQGKWEVGGGMGAYVPAGQLVRAGVAAVGQAERLGKATQGTEPLPDKDEQREILETVASLAAFPPGALTELSLRYGLLPDLDAGLRYSSTSWRLDARYKFLDQPGGVKLAGVLGAELHRFKGLFFDLYDQLKDLNDLFDFIDMGEFKRWDLDGALVASWNLFDGIVLPYANLRYRAAFYELPVVLTVDAPGEKLVASESIEGVLHYVGAGGGVGVGYKWAWVFVELNLAWAFSAPTILGQPADLGGITVYPALGLAIRP